jgi:hypothetical protein
VLRNTVNSYFSCVSKIKKFGHSFSNGSLKEELTAKNTKQAQRTQSSKFDMKSFENFAKPFATFAVKKSKE